MKEKTKYRIFMRVIKIFWINQIQNAIIDLIAARKGFIIAERYDSKIERVRLKLYLKFVKG
jgi:hypothetical protein